MLNPSIMGAISSLSSHTQKDIAAAVGAEHGYHVNNIVHGIALGVLRKARFAVNGENVKSCGDVMYLLANGLNPERYSEEWDQQKIERQDHPYHDGEVSCNAIRGALITLNVYHGMLWRKPECWVWRDV